MCYILARRVGSRFCDNILNLDNQSVILWSAPHVLSSSKLEGDAGDEDEDILEEESNPRIGVVRLEGVVGIVTYVDILAKQDETRS